MTDVSSYVNQMQNLAQANNAWSAQQAQKQMDFQKMMSDTAHQREVADLKAAGLNPVLSAGGSGAASASGAMASADTSATDAIGALFQTVLSTDNARAVAEMNNSAAMLRQQQSDSAALDRLLIQMQGKFSNSGSGGSSSKLNYGTYVRNDNPTYLGENFVNWTDGAVNALPDKGTTVIMGVRIPNSVIKYAWNSIGRDATIEILQNPNAQEILTTMFPNAATQNSAEEVSRDNDDPQKANPGYSMQSLGTLEDKYNKEVKELNKHWTFKQAMKVNEMYGAIIRARKEVKQQMKE